MATAKKTGIVSKVKDAITDMFSSDDAKRKPASRTTAGKAVKTTAKKAGKAVKKAGKAVKKVAKKVTSTAKRVTSTAKKATTTAKRTAGKKASRRSAPAKRSAPGTSMDRRLISLSQPHEVRDWCKSFGCSEAELRAAVSAVGNSSAKVRAHLGQGT